ncbi:MAG: hypothetical protein IT371_01980 [Deltaproteobacteria bacterium]|nr:hypothetical protein [Deltaproteobacteria bacterium]
MSCDLERLYGALTDKIDELETDIVFSAGTLAEPPAELRTDRLLIKKGLHDYQCYTVSRLDMLHLQGHKRTYAQLAQLVLAKVFHPRPETVRLHLAHPDSEVKQLVLDYRQGDEAWALVRGYEQRPYQYCYRPEEAQRHPLGGERDTQWTLPRFSLTNSENAVGPEEEDWRRRDTVRCAGSDFGSVLFAKVLLDLSRPSEACDEVVLEGDLGAGGVGPGSVEMTLWLPGSLGWDGLI